MDNLTMLIGSVGSCCASADINENAFESADSIINFKPWYTAPWANMEDRYLIRILSYANYSDLLQCRLVNKHFRHIISKSKLFLTSTIFVSSSKPDHTTDPEILKCSIPFENARFDFIDYNVFMQLTLEQDRITENGTFSPPTSFLVNLKSIQFQNSYITWETIKRLVNLTPALEQLSMTRCIFRETYVPTGLTEFDEYRIGRTFSHLKSIQITEYHNIVALNTLLGKLVGYCNHSLEQVLITFDPDDGGSPTTTQDDMDSFCNLIRTIIETNTVQLKVLSMDLKYQPLLNIFLPFVFGKMDSLWAELKLQEFLLSPSSTATTNTEICQNCIPSAQILIGFLESQSNLRKAALPHFRNMGEQHYRVKIGQSLPRSKLEYLSVPNQDYLCPEFLSKYTSLRKLYVGGATGDDRRPVALEAEIFDQPQPGHDPLILHRAIIPAHLDLNLALSCSAYTFFPTGSTATWDKFTELGIGSSIINGIELMNIFRKFRFLVKLEVTSQLPVMQDEDLQFLIEGMPWLQCLNVTACDFLTDYGVTGILRNSCEMMVRLHNYYEMDDNSILDNMRSNHGKSISQLKGMRNLALMGKSHITDVGINFGLRFPELQTACLPYNANITEWGVKKFGQHNKSLQVLVMSCTNQSSKEGFLYLMENHARVRKNESKFLNYIEDPDLLVNSSNSVTNFDILKDAVSSSMGGLCATFHCEWLFGKQTVEETEQEKAGVQDENDDRIPIPTLSILIPSFKEKDQVQNEEEEVAGGSSITPTELEKANDKPIKKSVLWKLELDVQDNNI